MDDILLELKDVEKSYVHGKQNNSCIKNISLQLKRGEIVSILGPSGCGKSTILKIIGGVLSADNGEVNFTKPDLCIGYVPQQASLMPNRTAYKNVSLVLEINNKVDSLTINKILRKVGMQEYQSMYPHQLSGGMQQKVSLARALVLEPDILLMDEPFSSIDEITRWQFNYDLINLLKNNHLSVLFVTHNVEEAVLLSDRILIMSGVKPASIEREIRISFVDGRNKQLFHSKEFFQQVIKVREILEKTTNLC